MSGTDKAKNKGQDLGGKAKEAVGKVTGDKSTENEGKVLRGTQNEYESVAFGEDEHR